MTSVLPSTPSQEISIRSDGKSVELTGREFSAVVPREEISGADFNHRWIVAFFGDPDADHFWWRAFTRHRSGYAHAYVMRYDAIAEVWFFIEWSRAGLDVRSLTRWQAVDNIDKLMREATCWEYTAPPRRSDYRKFPPLILHCVSVIKELLGIRAWWVWTPYQLARELERLGAKRIFHE